jgi:hypothetical protein
MDNTGSTEAAERKGLHWLLAIPLTLWCLLWLMSNGYNYIHLTWHLFRSLKWWSFCLLFSPCFWIWLGFFSSAAWAPLNFWLLPWGKYDRELSRTKIFLLVLFVPLVLGLALQYIGPYFYPITTDAQGNGHFLRFIPILGGRGYAVDGHDVSW